MWILSEAWSLATALAEEVEVEVHVQYLQKNDFLVEFREMFEQEIHLMTAALHH
jgi:hypothetical protein